MPMLTIHRRTIQLLSVIAAVALAGGSPLPPLPGVRAGTPAASLRSGRWSDPATWVERRVPGEGAAVRISRATTVVYDVATDRELASLDLEGSLLFASDRATRLDSGNIVIKKGGYLGMGTPAHPMPREVTAELRLVVPAGAVFEGEHFTPTDVGIWVFDGGRWEAYGAPIRHTWVKLARPARPGDAAVAVREDVSDWPRGAEILLTPTNAAPSAEDFEERRLNGVTRGSDGLSHLRLSAPLSRAHDGGSDTSGEVALLSRNVRIMSKYPDRPKAHTMYMAGATGGIAYAEFTRLGTLGVPGRYPVHFHRMDDSSRGMVVRGASIWRSDNHFLNIHQSNGITIEDTVGYDAPGNGFFIEKPFGTQGQQRTKIQGGRQGSGEVVDKKTAQRAQRGERRKGEGPFTNLDNRFLHNLAAKGFWRPGSLDKDNRVSLFWISSLNTVLIDNVAVGARGGRDNSGFHFTEGAQYSLTHAPLLMINNEAHSNHHHGLFSWTNAGLTFDVVGLRAWRNGKSGIAWGAYDPRFRVFSAWLSENGERNVDAVGQRIWIQDSVLQRAKVGLFFNRHFVKTDPDDPSIIVNTRFQEHRLADVAQDHQPCEAGKGCLGNYAVFANAAFLSPLPIDFGWHRSPHSWMEIINWANPPAGLPSSFRLVRSDQAGQGGRPVGAFNALLQPLQRAWDYPPRIEIAVLNDDGGRRVTVRARVQDDQGVAAVEFFVDGVLLKRVGPPFQVSWPAEAAARRPAYVFARAVDRQGNLGYSRVVRAAPPAR